jgi:Ca2+-binding RTX toxin-like protein
MNTTSSHTRRTLAAGTVSLLADAGLWLSALTPAQAAAPTCRGFAATIVGTSGSDEINGTNGRDVIVGLGGHDEIDGRGGNDVICAGAGNDEKFEGSASERVEDRWEDRYGRD